MNNCYLILFILSLFISYCYFNQDIVEGMIPDYYKELSFLNHSSINQEKLNTINKNYINLIRKLTNSTQGAVDLDEDKLYNYMANQIAKARRITENEIMKNPKFVNPDGSWNNEIISYVENIINDIHQEEENEFQERIKSLNDKEKKEEISQFKQKKDKEEKNIQEQINRWGKPLYLMTKKEMDTIFKNQKYPNTPKNQKQTQNQKYPNTPKNQNKRQGQKQRNNI
tara:strand:- start:3252 stop:3929 length:678 start_codon:yes stop_codon:yes gene_type:complete